MGLDADGSEWKGMEANGSEWMRMETNGREWKRMQMKGRGCKLYEEYRIALGGQLQKALSKALRPDLEPERASMVYKRIVDSIKRAHLNKVKGKIRSGYKE